MKVGLVVPGGVDRSGEVRVIPALLDLIERLALRHEVHVFALYQEPTACTYELKGAVVHCVAGGRRVLRSLLAIVRENRKGAFDIMHGFWLIPGGLIAGLAAGWLGIGSVVHVAGGELVNLSDIRFGSQRTWRGRVLTKLAMIFADVITVASKPIEDLVESHGYPALRVPLGVDVERFHPPPDMVRGPSVGRSGQVLAIGTINGVKDFETLMRAFGRFRHTFPDWTLSVVGEDILDGQIQELAQELSLSESVTFCGFERHRALAERLAHANMLVVSSRFEAGPVAAVEAAACGVTVVGTAVGHLVDWAAFGVEQVDPRDWKALGDAMIRAAENGATHALISERLLGWARAFDADWTSATFEGIYRDA